MTAFKSRTDEYKEFQQVSSHQRRCTLGLIIYIALSACAEGSGRAKEEHTAKDTK
jgi:hypothetical protein